jgi:hypothetical protein
MRRDSSSTKRCTTMSCGSYLKMMRSYEMLRYCKEYMYVMLVILLQVKMRSIVSNTYFLRKVITALWYLSQPHGLNYTSPAQWQDVLKVIFNNPICTIIFYRHPIVSCGKTNSQSIVFNFILKNWTYKMKL